MKLARHSREETHAWDHSSCIRRTLSRFLRIYKEKEGEGQWFISSGHSKHMILSLNCLLKTSPEVIKMQHPFLCYESTAAPENSPEVSQHCQGEQQTLLHLSLQRQYILWYTDGISSCSPSHKGWTYSKIMLGFTPEPPSQHYSSRKVPSRKRKYLISFVTKLLATELSCIGITFFHCLCFSNLVLWVCPWIISSILQRSQLSKKITHGAASALPHRWKKSSLLRPLHIVLFTVQRLAALTLHRQEFSIHLSQPFPPDQADAALKYFHPSALPQPFTESPPGLPKGVL